MLKGLFAATVVVALVFCSANAPATAQTYPSRPIKLINGFAAGGNADVVARLVARKVSDRLGQPIVLESRPGAGTQIANSFVAKSEPDGYTLLLVSGAYPTLAATSKSLNYDPVGDFAWVSMLVSYPLVVVVRPEAPYRSVEDLISAAQAKPSQLNYPSPGVGSLVHLAAEQFNVSARTNMTHIPYRGGAEPLTELISGRMDVGFETLTFVSPQLEAGKVRALAVTSSARVPALPEVPALSESLPGYEAISFLGIAAAKGTPTEIVTRLNEEFRQAVADPEIAKRLRDVGGTPWSTTEEEMKNFVSNDIQKWKHLVANRAIEVR